MQVDTWNLDLRAAIFATWERLPLMAREALKNVRFTEERGIKVWAQADSDTVYVRALPRQSQDAGVGILVHELGHIAGRHYERVNAGVLSREAAEAEADRYARAWGFNRELEMRKAVCQR